MNKKRLVIAIVCVLLAVLLIGSLFVAAGVVFANAGNFQFGGLVGELLASNRDTQKHEQTNDPTESNPDTDALLTDNTHTEAPPYEDTTAEFSYEDTADVLPEPKPDDKLALQFFLEGGAVWINNNNNIQNFFESGKASEWNHRVIIQNYQAESVSISGWAAIFTETSMQIGYRIDDGQSIYGYYSGFRTADQSTTEKALDMGAIRAADVWLSIPVRYLSGTHTINILVRNQGGGDESVICTFEIEKAESPYTPVFLADATYLSDMLSTQHNVGMDKYQYKTPAIEGYGSAICIKTSFDHGYLTVLPVNGESHSTDARYLAIKWRNIGIDSAKIYVGSGAGPGDGNDLYTLKSTGHDWQFVLIDLEEIGAVNDSYDITYLRFDFFTNLHEDFEIAYVATFETVEDAKQYDADHPYLEG